MKISSAVSLVGYLHGVLIFIDCLQLKRGVSKKSSFPLKKLMKPHTATTKAKLIKSISKTLKCLSP